VPLHPFDELVALLDREREAARRADLDTLVELQEAKRIVVEQISHSELPRDRLAELAEKAHSNIWLLRHLVQCLQGMINEGEEPTYSATGKLPAPGGGSSRGNA
jgi:hypothetical protein